MYIFYQRSTVVCINNWIGDWFQPFHIIYFKTNQHSLYLSKCWFSKILEWKRTFEKSKSFCNLHIFYINALTSDIHKCFLWTDLIFNFPESVLTRKKVIVVKSIQTVRISFNLKAVRICGKVITETLFNCNNNLPLMTAITGKVQ